MMEVYEFSESRQEQRLEQPAAPSPATPTVLPVGEAEEGVEGERGRSEGVRGEE